MNVHAPTKDIDEEEKEEFYDTLEEIFYTTVGNIKMVLGNLNVHRLHEHSGNGSRLANFALGKGLIIKSTMFPLKDIYKYTWVLPDGRHENQIDHVLISNRFKNGITNV